MDPCRLEEGLTPEALAEVQTRAAALLTQAAESILTALAATTVPETVLLALRAAARGLVQQGLSSDRARLAVVRGLFFLRFVSPAIVSPQRYAGLREMTAEQQRVLVLVGKVIQALVSGVEWDGSKESYMRACNSFVVSHQPTLLALAYRLIPDQQEAGASESTPNTPKGSLLKRLVRSKEKKEVVVVSPLRHLQEQWPLERRTEEAAARVAANTALLEAERQLAAQLLAMQGTGTECCLIYLFVC